MPIKKKIYPNYTISECDYSFIVRDGSKPIGSGGLKMYKDGLQCEIVGLHIDKEYRNRGLGIELFKTLIEKAKDLGVKEIDATTTEDNKRIIEFCERCGFKKYLKFAKFIEDKKCR